MTDHRDPHLNDHEARCEARYKEIRADIQRLHVRLDGLLWAIIGGGGAVILCLLAAILTYILKG